MPRGRTLTTWRRERPEDLFSSPTKNVPETSSSEDDEGETPGAYATYVSSTTDSSNNDTEFEDSEEPSFIRHLTTLSLETVELSRAASTSNSKQKKRITLFFLFLVSAFIIFFVILISSPRFLSSKMPQDETTSNPNSEPPPVECNNVLDVFEKCPECTLEMIEYKNDYFHERLSSLKVLLGLDEAISSGNSSVCEPSRIAMIWLVNTTENFQNVSTQRLIDRYQLVRFYASFSGQKWRLKTLWLSQMHECEWLGVICNASKRVVGLSLASNNLQGHTSSFSMNWLSQFETLDLISNSIRGPFPPPSTLTNMKGLDLFNNQLTGFFPTDIGVMTSLKLLSFGSNLISGTIPTSIQMLTVLETFDALNNGLFGTIPFKNFPRSITKIDLSGNNLSGSIPEVIRKLKNLTTLLSRSCAITGTLPSSLGDLRKLVNFTVQDNQIEGTIPKELANIQTLERFNVGQNCKLAGTLPPLIAVLPRISFVGVGDTFISGEFPGLPFSPRASGDIVLSCRMACAPICPFTPSICRSNTCNDDICLGVDSTSARTNVMKKTDFSSYFRDWC